MEPGQDSYQVSYEDGYVSVAEEMAEEQRVRDGMNYMSGTVLKQQLIPFHTMLATESSKDVVPISNLSGVIYTKPTSSSTFSDVVAIIGKGGFIYHARLLPASSKNIVEFINVTKLRFPPAYRLALWLYFMSTALPKPAVYIKGGIVLCCSSVVKGLLLLLALSLRLL